MGCSKRLLIVGCVLASVLAQGTFGGASSPRLLRIGERIYREGILPSGKPVTALVNGDIPVEGTQFTCVSCHQRSGRGSIEGWQVASPVTRDELYSAKNRRPAYRDDTLATAIREAIDPTGRQLASAMPAYDLDDREMAGLISYLKSLSAEISPGVSAEEIHFATVFTHDTESADMLAVLEGYFEDKNAETRGETRRRNKTWLRDNRYNPYRKWRLHRWELQGDPATWKKQLRHYYAKQPVFAMVSGMTTGTWAPMHEFCEEQGIPAVLPNVDVPVMEEDDFYTIYFSRGPATEARVLAQHLSRSENIGNVLQVYSSTFVGESAAQALRDAFEENDGPRLHEWQLATGEKLDAARLSRSEERTKADAIVLWLSGDAFEGDWGGEPQADGARIYLSSIFLDEDPSELSGAIRARSHLIHPFSLPGERNKRFRRIAVWLERRGIEASNTRVVGQTWFAAMVLGEGLMHVRFDGYYRDFLLESIDHITERIVPFSSHYPRPSFGPGQRYISKGSYLVDLSPAHHDDSPQWIVPR